MKRQLTRIVSAVVVSFAIVGGDVRAANVGIRPTILSLPANGTSGTVVVENQGTEDLRVQVTVARWTHTTSGEQVLRPTEDLVAYPTLSVIPAGKVLRVRVGPLKRVARTTEASFRIIVEELPRPAGERDSPSVNVRTRLSVPVFLAPSAKPLGRVRLDTPDVSASRVAATLVNSGNVHLRYEQVRVRGYDRRGVIRFEEMRPGWYLLAGETRLLEVPVPPAVCDDLAAVSVEVPVANTVLKEQLNAARCGV